MRRSMGGIAEPVRPGLRHPDCTAQNGYPASVSSAAGPRSLARTGLWRVSLMGGPFRGPIAAVTRQRRSPMEHPIITNRGPSSG